MSSDKNAFPFRDLIGDEATALRDVTGGERPDGALVESFLRTGRLPLVKKPSPGLLGLLGSAYDAVLESTDDPTGRAKTALIKGALFYIATFRQLHQTPELPVRGGAVAEVKRLSPPDLIVRTSEAVDSTPRFRGLLDAMMVAVQLPDVGTVAHVGAGAVHLALEESARSADRGLDAYENDPDMADLQQLFAGFGQ